MRTGIIDTYLCDEHDNNQSQTNPRTGDAEDGPEGDLVKGVAVILPCVPEADVGEADAAPGEECSQTGQRLEPVEGDGSTGVECHERKRGPCENKDGCPQRSASTINVGEEARRITLLSKCTQCTRAAVDTRKTDRNDRQHDDHVGEVSEPDDAGTFSNNNERRGFDIDHARTQKPGVGVLD